MERNQLLLPLPETEWPAGLADSLSGSVLNIHRMIAHNPALMAAYAPLRNYLVKDSCLTDRQRELLILRTAHNLQSAYEWTHHVARGRAVGLTDSEIARVQDGPGAPGWSNEEEMLLRCADEMHQHQELQVETAHSLQVHLGSDGLIAAIFTIGLYLTLGTILKSFAVPLDETINPL